MPGAEALKLIFLSLNINTLSTMLHMINEDLYALIKSFQRKSYWRLSCPKEAAYWKNRFTQDVVPQLDKGYKLVCIRMSRPCDSCYRYCNICPYHALENTSIYESISYMQMRSSAAWTSIHFKLLFKLWNHDQYQKLFNTVYGRYVLYPWTQNRLVYQIRRSRLYRKIRLQSRVRVVEEATAEAIPYIAGLFRCLE